MLIYLSFPQFRSWPEVEKLAPSPLDLAVVMLLSQSSVGSSPPVRCVSRSSTPLEGFIVRTVVKEKFLLQGPPD